MGTHRKPPMLGVAVILALFSLAAAAVLVFAALALMP